MSGTAAALINPLDSFAKRLGTTRVRPGFQLLIFATNWGFYGSWDEFCLKIKQAGYDGAEAWYPADENQRQEFLNAFQKHGLQFGFLVGGSDSDYQKHLAQFKSSLEKAAALKPVYINCHSGRDHFHLSKTRPSSSSQRKSVNGQTYRHTMKRTGGEFCIQHLLPCSIWTKCSHSG